jgi:transcriptional regulator with XRE-family HTH domain
METIGHKIRKLRKQRGLTQDQLAFQLCVSRQTISSWETGRNIPDIDTVKKIATIFGTTTDFLILLNSQKMVSVGGDRTYLVLYILLAILLIERITQLSTTGGLLWMDFLIAFLLGDLYIAYKEHIKKVMLIRRMLLSECGLIIFGFLGILSGYLNLFFMGFGFKTTCLVCGMIAILFGFINVGKCAHFLKRK